MSDKDRPSDVTEKSEIIQCEHTFEFVLLGDAGVGKSSLLNQFIENKYDDAIESSVEVNLGMRVTTVNNKKIKLRIWDTVAQEDWIKNTKQYYKDAHCIILA